MTTKQTVATGSIAAIMVIGIFIAVLTAQSDSTATQSAVAGDTTTTQQAQTATSDSTSKAYQATVAYNIPRKDEQNNLSVTMSVNDTGTITAVSAKTTYNDDDSVRYAAKFEKNISGAIVGKPLKGLQISRVGGASLSSQAFNQALANIADQAL